MYIGNEAVTTKPHAEIREALVTGIRNNPEKSERMKRAAEVLIGVIDADGTDDAFQQAYVVFQRAAAGEPMPSELLPEAVAKALGRNEGEA